MNQEIIRDAIRTDERQQMRFKVGHQNLFGILHLPFTEHPAPAVVFCHGLAGDKTGRYRAYVLLASMLAKHGIASFRFDCRGCGDSDGELGQVTISSLIEDTVAATKLIQEHPRIDRNRLGIFGRSFGGIVAVHAAAALKVFESIVLWSAVFNGDPWDYLRVAAREGTMDQNLYNDTMTINGQTVGIKLWEELFATDTKAKMAALSEIPLLHLHGEKDKRVVITQAHEYENARKGSTAPTRFMRMPEGDHDLDHLWEREEAFEATVEWFRQTL